MDWILIGKTALVAFLVVASGVLVITYLRKSRRSPTWRPPIDSGYMNTIRPGVPPTPLPEWVNWTDYDEASDSAANNPDKSS